jgi:hypothetical protein
MFTRKYASKKDVYTKYINITTTRGIKALLALMAMKENMEQPIRSNIAFGR